MDDISAFVHALDRIDEGGRVIACRRHKRDARPYDEDFNRSTFQSVAPGSVAPTIDLIDSFSWLIAFIIEHTQARKALSATHYPHDG